MAKKFIVRHRDVMPKEDKSVTMSLRLYRSLQAEYDQLALKSGAGRCDSPWTIWNLLIHPRPLRPTMIPPPLNKTDGYGTYPKRVPPPRGIFFYTWF